MNFDYLTPAFLFLNMPVIIFALTIHEYSHALIAYKLGDNTAERLGRLSLNPLVHLDVFGTILMILAGFGWAKPVPVDTRNFENPKKGMLYVALAGPVSNLLTAIIAGLILRYVFFNYPDKPLTESMFTALKILNLTLIYSTALAIFNMIPLPPLDGSRVVNGLLPDNLGNSYRKIEPYGIIILFGIFIFGGAVFSKFLWYPINYITLLLTGISI